MRNPLGKKIDRQFLAEAILEQAIAYVEAGLSVLPLRLDGSKGPAIKWKPRQSALPRWKELERDFSKPAGIGVVCGLVSSGLEVLDFDAAELFEPWRNSVAEIAGKLPIVRTPKKGFHVWFRCSVVSTNAKIAFLSGRQEAAIETRGEGGFVVAPGSPAAVHASGKLYEQISGPTLPRPSLAPGRMICPGIGVPLITEGEREELWAAARALDESGQIEAATQAAAKKLARQLRGSPPTRADLSTPWDHYDFEGPNWEEILVPHGWRSTDGRNWFRPGKSEGSISAHVTIGTTGAELLTVFSSNAGPLAATSGAHRTLGKFAAFAALNHRGDRQAAARELKRLGWGRSAA